MDFVRVASVSDVEPGRIIPIEAKGRKLLLTQVDGRYHAAARKCPHLGFNLCRGKIEDGAIVCLLHKASFNLETGKVERDPRLLFIDMKARKDLAIYPVKVEGADILVGV